MLLQKKYCVAYVIGLLYIFFHLIYYSLPFSISLLTLFNPSTISFFKMNEISDSGRKSHYSESHSRLKGIVGYDKAGERCTPLFFFLLSTAYLASSLLRHGADLFVFKAVGMLEALALGRGLRPSR